jgi:predicted RNA binding protein YcfA (HicA-like mRNA interferase family)
LKSVSGKQFAKALERAGWTLLRVNGSHLIYGKDGRRERISVPIHASENLKPGLFSHFLRVSGLNEREI